jgi:hypothetical protein
MLSLGEIAFADPDLKQYQPDADCFTHWSWLRSADQVQVKISDEATNFRFEFVGNDSAYLVTGNPGSITRPPEEIDLQHIPPGSRVCFTISVAEISESAKIKLYMIQYDKSQRIGSKALQLQKGLNYLNVTTGRDIEKYRLAIRFAGFGSVAITSINMRTLAL